MRRLSQLFRFSPDGRRLLRVFLKGPDVRGVSPAGVEVYWTTTGDLAAEWTGELPTEVWKGDISSAGTVAVIHADTLYVIDPKAAGSEPVRRTVVPSEPFTAVAFSADGRRLVTISDAATVWDATAWEVRKRYEWQVGRLRQVCFAPDGLRGAAAGDAGQVVVWDLDD